MKIQLSGLAGFNSMFKAKESPPGEGEHSEEGRVQVAGVLVTLDAFVPAAEEEHRVRRDRGKGPRNNRAILQPFDNILTTQFTVWTGA